MATAMAAPPLTWRLPMTKVRQRVPSAMFSRGVVQFRSPRVVVAAGGDLSVLIPVGGLLFGLYWVSNFVVAEMVAKDLRQQDELARGDSSDDTDKK